MSISVTIDCCKECPYIKKGTDGRTRIGDRVLIVYKCSKKRGTRLIKDASIIPYWCPLKENIVSIPKKYDISFYKKEISKKFLGLPTKHRHFYVGSLHITKGGWNAKILLCYENSEYPTLSNLLVLHAIPAVTLDNLGISNPSFTNNSKDLSYRIEYVLAFHVNTEIRYIISSEKLLGNKNLFNLAKRV